jgi:hypothetical protein
MMRFVSARAVFEEFPTLAQAVKLEATDEDPRDFVRGAAAAGKLRDAAAVCAFVLNKRDAVWWICRCLRSRPGLVEPASQALLAAEAWAREPGEEERVLCDQWARASDQQAPAAWAAYAAGFSSGNLAMMPEGPVRTPGHLTPDSARVALVLAECRLEPEDARGFLREAVDAALRWMTAGGDAAPS